jgi:hypothetical protein
MTTKQKIKILEDVISELSEFKDKYSTIPEDFSIHESKLQSLIDAIDPEPLDPHTCDLIIGDVVLDKTDNNSIVIYKIMNPENFAFNIQGFNITQHLPCSYKRHQLILIQRNGIINH